MRPAMDEVDFDAEGLLEGVEGAAREARRRLLEELHQDGVSMDELRTAVEEERLALLPVERILSGGERRFSAAEVAERAGVDEEFLGREWRALGMALSGDEAKVYSDQDVEAGQARADDARRRRSKGGRARGRSPAGDDDVAARRGQPPRDDAFMREGDTEYDVANRFAGATRAFMPLIGETLSYALALHLREQIRHDAFGLAEVSSGHAAKPDEVTVCFADMVDFTRLGETLEPEALGGVTGRLGELAAAAVEPPVRLVKMIGDAAMLVGPEPGPVVDAALELVDAAGREGEEFPLLRAGLASGKALPRSGDWYGRPVNIASRITAIARPASVLAAEEVRDALAGSYEWSFAGPRRLKGIEGSVKLFRCRGLQAV